MIRVTPPFRPKILPLPQVPNTLSDLDYKIYPPPPKCHNPCPVVGKRPKRKNQNMLKTHERINTAKVDIENVYRLAKNCPLHGCFSVT